MRDRAEKRIGAGASIAAHLALLAVVLAFSGPNQVARRQSFRTEVSFELLPQPNPVRDAQEEREKTETGSSSSLGSTQDLPTRNIRTDIPQIEDSLSFDASRSPVQSSEQASPSHELATSAGANSETGSSNDSGSRNGDGGHKQNLSDLRPDWIVMPSPKTMADYYPLVASRDGVSGGVVLACLIDHENRARSCRVLKEKPRDYGFGYAALDSARIFRIRPPLREGKPRHDVWVRIPVFFNKKR